MKSEERHQLEKNDLAEWVVQTYERWQPHWPYLVGGIVLVAAALWFVNHRQASQAQQLHAAWNAYFDAEGTRNVEALRSLVDLYPDSSVAPLAQKRVADFRFADGKKLLLTDRGEALRLLDDAANIYQELSASPAASDIVRRQAQLGLALAQETTGALAKAKETYESVSQSFPGTEEAARAEQRLKKIELPEAAEFYDQLAAFKAPEPTTDLPKPKGGLPELPAPKAQKSMPDAPLISLPGLEDVPTPPPPPAKPAATKAKASPKADPAESTTKKPAASKPTKAAAEKPAVSKPSKAAAEKPPASKPAKTTPEKPASSKPAKSAEPKAKPAAPAKTPAATTPKASTPAPQEKASPKGQRLEASCRCQGLGAEGRIDVG